MAEMTAADAAEHLQVSQRQVRRLASNGVLATTRVVGRTLLLDAASVHQLAGRTRHNGRPWTAATAWAALALLSGQHAPWMDSAALSRLRHRLRGARATEVAWLARGRARVHQMHGWGQDAGLILTGVSALRDPKLSALFDLSPAERGVDGYAAARHFDDMVTDLGLFDDVEGDITVRVVPDDAGYEVDRPLIAAVAVDLSESLDTREAAAGQRVLNDLLDAFRTGDGRAVGRFDEAR
ncbi:MerR family transcriptional regulator [Mycolicibacterium austroafricanum]|uniref:helix-turn-helix domain-containing protein n=1 Tax=Mycolicibacterium austroafricanum TaxID=39687 RepID=UPI000A044FB2|nr:helix-turn-helix domain-containing protein [Mycolicibacterium austroafricanum]